MNDAKESYMGHLSCKSHTARTEKELYRICPSKLNKRELEDLYFALLEQNVQLKKTVNEQRDQIKVLNTRVHRMTVQRPMVGFHNKDCCAGSKAIINEQKEIIADLKKDNERLSERLRLLNMRLCSAKQFLRRGSSQAGTRCSKCLVSGASIKNSSTSALNTKRSDTKLDIDSSPCQLEKDSTPTGVAEMDIPTQSAEVTSSRAELQVRDAPCRRNECRAEIDELKLKIVALEEEACGVRRSHSERMRALEAEAGRARDQLRGSRQRTDELWSQLQQQRALVCSLREDGVAARLDRAAARLTNRSLPLNEVSERDPPERVASDWEDSPPIVAPNNSVISLFVDEKCHKNSDDSGFADYKKQNFGDEKEKTLRERDDSIESRIANLQSQLDNLKTNVTETRGAALGTESSLSHDIFSTARFKTLADFDKIPSTSREPEDNKSAHAPGITQKYGPEFKYHISGPLSLDMPEMSRGATGTNIKTTENETKYKNAEGSPSSRGSIKINANKIEQNKKETNGAEENVTIDSHHKSNQIIEGMIDDDKTNSAFKKHRRSSLKSNFERKQSRDLAVRYGQTQTYKSAAGKETTAKYVSQGTDIDKVFVEPDEDQESDPSVQYKVNERTSIRRIRYRNDPETEQMSPGLDADNKALRGGETNETDNGGDTRQPRDVERTVFDVRNDTASQEMIANVDTSTPVLCGGLSRVCMCPPGSAPGAPSLRSCSGTIVAIAPPLVRFRPCACGQQPLQSPEPCPASPDRTDCEVSSLTDLTHTHETDPLSYRSPGEEKATSTLSESYATTDCGSLSEGEVPVAGGKRLSTTADKMTEPDRSSRSNKMEEALRAISEELTICRELLQGRRGESGPPPASPPPPLSLRRAEGSCRMRDSYTHKCIFTLHVGTAVLADQAAACARGRSLCARWRFYRQPATDTRALRGRVFNYDCTTHYDLTLTDRFLYYLKHEEMPIVICEPDKRDEAFATCALPLRDALLHPNRRVDMSLALVPGGWGGAEAGVLDVWCSLRVDAAALPAINAVIVRPSLKSQHQSSSILEQILDDDQSVDYRFSRDLHQNRETTEDNQSDHSESLDKVTEVGRSYNKVIENEVPTNIRSVNDFKQAVAKKSNDSTNIYEMLKNTKWNRRSTLGSQKTQDGGRLKSVTICNRPSSSSNDRRNMLKNTPDISAEENPRSLDITILWLALNENCEAMSDPSVRRLHVTYSLLGRSGADLETPVGLPKPKHSMDKCHFLFKKSFPVIECDMSSLGRLARCVRAAGAPDPARAVVFSVVGETADDSLGLESREDVGRAYLYLGEVLSRSAGASYTSVLEVSDARGAPCGALAVRLDGLALLRRCRDRAGPPAKFGEWVSRVAVPALQRDAPAPRRATDMENI